jgi:hypothetical protein
VSALADAAAEAVVGTGGPGEFLVRLAEVLQVVS